MKEPNTKLDARLETLCEYMLAKPATSDGFPFGPEVMVFKVAGKIFAISPWEANPISVSLKCDPDRAVELREQHEGIIPGYHLNKKHWNTVVMDDSVSMDLMHELIDHSYDLIVASLTKKQRESM